MGVRILKTPELDKFREGAVRFTDFHVAPMCSPTRGQLMTGIDAMRNGCTAVCQGRSMMRAELPTMADYFAKSRATPPATSAKWHLGDSYPHRPQDRGFEETIHHRAWGITSLADYWTNHSDVYFDPVLSHNGVDKEFKGYCTDIFFNEAMQWISEQQAAEKPFFVYLPTNTPHVPNVCPEEFSEPYVGNHEGKPIPAEFYGMIANIDENLGRLEEFLEETGLKENTIVIYMTDNGTQSTPAKEIFNYGMRDKKTSVYEGGHRVPLFVRWPEGKLAHGRDVDELTQVQDLLPTLIELCGLKKQKSPLPFDGTSLAGLLKGSQKELPDRKLVVQYRVSGEPWDPAVVLWDKWRLIGGKQLYHVGEDPGQEADVAAAHPEVVEAMAAHYDEWHGEAKELFDRPRWITIGSKKANPMILYAQDWTGDYCDNMGGLRRGTALGYWNVVVDRPGTYAVELRRWPKESEKFLTEGREGPEDKGFSARPIVAANLRVAGANYTLDAPAGSTHATFHVELPAGKTQLETNLLDSEDRALCGAMYVYLGRLDDGGDATLTPVSKREPQGRAPAPPAPGRKGKGKGGKGKGAPKQAVSVELGPGDRLLADFEGEDYGDWKVTGTAFGSGPSRATEKVALHEGRGLVDTFMSGSGDGTTGSLSSPVFTIEHATLNFLVGGGSHRGKTCVNLVIDGEVVESATGPASKDERKRKVMRWVSWDLGKWQGKKAQVVIVDEAEKGWGHIVVDQVYLSKRPAGAPPGKNASKAGGTPTAGREKGGHEIGTGKDRPNFVLIFIDDMGYGDIGPFGASRATPHLDRMAEEGMKLTDFYVSSAACTPSRAALMTGCYADRIGMGRSVVFPADERGLNPEEITIAEILRGGGYATGCFGKWHLGDQPGFMPLAQGFDVYEGIPYSNDMWMRGNPKKNHPPLPWIKQNRAVAHIPDEHSQARITDGITEAAVKFIRENKNRSFFAYVPHSAVHAPFMVTPERLEAAGGDVMDALIGEIDRSTGRILDTLRELGLDEKTLVLFTNDNGGGGKTSRGPLRGAKFGPKYEGHMRVATLAWWPGTIPAGSLTSEIGATIDLLPTLASLAGEPIPADRVIDGHDISDLLLGRPGAKSPHEMLFYENGGVRRGNWKLVHYKVKADRHDELYDLGKDLGETKNVAGEHPQLVAELKAALDAHVAEIETVARPAAFVENPRPLLEDAKGLPTLAEYLK